MNNFDLSALPTGFTARLIRAGMSVYWEFCLDGVIVTNSASSSLTGSVEQTEKALRANLAGTIIALQNVEQNIAYLGLD